MGVSCDFETGSMESEIKPTCNKEFIKLNGQHELEATPAISTDTEVITIDDSKSDVIVDLASPTPQPPPPPETETIVIIDDAEPEEGEIIASDNDFEYEAISSDEELSLRQQIEALEAKNRELVKIASISTRGVEYGYLRSPNYSNYKALNKNHTKQNPPSSSVTSFKASSSLSHVENISSDEAQLIDSENEFGNLLDSSKSYIRSHRTSKKEKRQSRARKTRVVDGEKERCSAHGKRRCTDIVCFPINQIPIPRRKRARHKYDDRKPQRTKYSSESEDELLRNREELKMALNIIEPTNRPINSSTLSHKLSAIQNQQTLDECKKSSKQHRKRKNSKSPERDRRRRRVSENNNGSKHTRVEHRSRSRTNDASPIVAQDTNENEIQEDDDEAISLEEQELRLIALKSAVLKKHEARKRKLMANQVNDQVARPYSPTDSVVMVPDENGERSNDCIDSDNNNMDISPISSPGNQYQPMDMELASSNENSKSPIFSYEKPQTFPTYEPFIDWAAVTVPVPISPFGDIDQTASLNQQFAMQSPFPLLFDPIQKEPLISPISTPTPPELNRYDVNDEEELRAQLIEQMRNTNTNGTVELKMDAPANIVPKEMINVDSLEEDCLRSLLLSSKGKKSTAVKEMINEVSPSTTSSSKFEPSNQAKCDDDMPKLGGVLREALNRLKNKQQNKQNECKKETEKVVDERGDSLRDCDQNVIQKTVVNNQLDQNKNELCTADTNTSFVSTKPAKEKVPLRDIEEKMPLKTVEEKAPTKSTEDKKTAEDKAIVIRIPNENVQKVEKIVEKASIEEVNKANETPVTISVVKATVKPTVKTNATPAAKMTKPKPKVIAKPKPIVAVVNARSTEPPVAKESITATTTTTVATTLNKMESIRKKTGSPIITNWTVKPVKRLIISLNEDSSTDNDDMDCDSPQSSVKNYSSSPSNDSNNTFQLRLDQFLQTVRANSDSVQETKPPVVVAVPTPEEAKTTTKVVAKSVTIQKIQASKIESTKAVSHLPMSSQLEYHRLLNRMKLLEKQKEQKSRLATKASKNGSNFPSLTVIVQNENRFIQPNNPNDTDCDKNASEPIKPLVVKVATTKPLTPITNTSLAKKVLVKNAIDTLVSTRVNIELKQDASSSTQIPAVKPAVTVPIQVLSPVQSVEQPSSSANETKPSISTISKPTSMSLADFAKATPKIRASMLANYVKRYKTHGTQYLNGLIKLQRLTSRTNYEMKKQQRMELTLDELKRQTKIIEEQLAEQKILTKTLYPAIVTTEKAVTSDRTMLLKLQNCCNKMGNIDNGPDYKVQCDNENEIKENIKQITIEKNKLKLFVPKVPAIQASNEPNKKVQTVSINVTANKLPPKPTSSIVKETKIDCVKTPANQADVETESTINAEIPTDSRTENNGIEKIQNKPIENRNQSGIEATQSAIEAEPVKMDIDIETNLPETIENSQQETQSPQIVITEPSNENQRNLMKETKAQLNNELSEPDRIEAAKNRSVDVETFSSDNLTMMDVCVTDTEPIYGKYDSPLDHMQSESDAKPSLSVADRNAIVCPYDLMGRCEDKQCEYKHLTM